MMTDNALAKFCIFLEMLDSGDTGRRGAEHSDLLLLWFSHNIQ
jgi:hypothetical protein